MADLDGGKTRMLQVIVETEGERDRARNAAAALEAENAELRRGLARVRDRDDPTDDDVCMYRESGGKALFPSAWGVIATATLARTDPLRGGE